MSVTARFNSTMIHAKEVALRYFRNTLLLIGLLLSLALPQAFASDLADTETQTVSRQSDTPSEDSPASAHASALSPQMRAALDYVKSRYKVSKDAILPLFEAVQRIGKERSIDPLLIVALIGIESGFNPEVKSATGGHGLMQIIPRYHLGKIPDGLGVKGLMDPIVNVRVGAHILDDAIRRGGSTTAGLQSYNGSDKKHRFANRVLAEKARLERAAP